RIGRLVPNATTLTERMLTAVGAENGIASSSDDSAWVALRIAYRRSLAEIAAIDVMTPEPASRIVAISAALADAAGAALEASLAVARARVAAAVPAEGGGLRQVAIIGMGKAGASVPNYLSDLDGN